MAPQRKPVKAFVLSFIGGVSMLIGGWFWAVSSFPEQRFAWAVPVVNALGPLWGILVLISATMLYVEAAKPRTRIWGSLIIIFAVISSIFTWPGEVLGTLETFIAAGGLFLGVMGGFYGIQPKQKPTIAGFVPYRICPHCRGVFEKGMEKCPHCGKTPEQRKKSRQHNRKKAKV